MTCIVAVEAPEGVWVGSDSFVGTPDTVDICDRPKVRRVGRAWVGFAGDIAIGQAIIASSWPQRKRGEDPLDYLVRALAPEVRRAYKDTPQPGAFRLLVVLDRRTYECMADGGVTRSGRGYTAIGAGEDFALGALHATANDPPERRVRAALAAAAEFSPLVCKPFHVLKV